MFSDPQTVTISGAGNTLPRIASLPTGGTFSKDDSNVILKVNHSVGKRARHTVRLDLRKIAADPFVGSLNAQYSMSAYLTVDVPIVGYTVAEAVAGTAGLLTWCTASTNANLTKLLGGEN